MQPAASHPQDGDSPLEANRRRRAEQLRQARDQHAPHTRGGRRGCEARGAAARHEACLWRPPRMSKARSWRRSSSAARPPAGWICLIPGCSTQHPRAQRARVAQIATRGYGPMVQASAHVTARAFALSTRPGCPANVSACCALLARDGLHTTSAGAVAVARIVHAWVRASAPPAERILIKINY